MDTIRGSGVTRQVILTAAGATAVALYFGFQKVLGAAMRAGPVAWERLMGTELYYWYLLAAFLPAVVALTARVRIRRGHAVGALALHSGAAILIGIAHSVIYVATLAAVLGVAPMAATVGRELPTAVMTVFWKYWVVVGVYYAFDYHRKYRERQEHAATLERSLTEARLEALRMQLNPHFLFNTLHTASMLNHENPEAANRVLSRLSELLRIALDTKGVQEVPLADELEFVRRYLEIEQARFQDRLQVSVHVPDALLGSWVPNLLLQPLVENAVRHGLAPSRRDGRVSVSARREGDKLVVAVCDNGPGLPATGAAGSGSGIGLDNVRARLAALYGGAASLRLETPPAGGVCAVVQVPFHVGPAPASAAAGSRETPA